VGMFELVNPKHETEHLSIDGHIVVFLKQLTSPHQIWGADWESEAKIATLDILVLFKTVLCPDPLKTLF